MLEHYEKFGQKRHRNIVIDVTDRFIVNFEQFSLLTELFSFLIRNIISLAVKLTVAVIPYKI